MPIMGQSMSPTHLTMDQDLSTQIYLMIVWLKFRGSHQFRSNFTHLKTYIWTAMLAYIMGGLQVVRVNQYLIHLTMGQEFLTNNLPNNSAIEVHVESPFRIISLFFIAVGFQFNFFSFSYSIVMLNVLPQENYILLTCIPTHGDHLNAYLSMRTR